MVEVKDARVRNPAPHTRFPLFLFVDEVTEGLPEPIAVGVTCRTVVLLILSSLFELFITMS